MGFLKKGNKAFFENKYEIAYQLYNKALSEIPELAEIIQFNIDLMRRRGYVYNSNCLDIKKNSEKDNVLKSLKKMPITVLVITWDVGHNPLGRSYMIAEVAQRVARHSLLIGFQFSRYGTAIWEPVREGQMPVITLPGSNLPEFYESLQAIASRIKPDVVIACKPRLPSVVLGMMIKEKWNCPLIVDVDDHELAFFNNQSELSLDELSALPSGTFAQVTEPYEELWTRLTQSLCKSADEIIVSNVALQQEFGGTIIPHVRNETTFDPSLYNKYTLRQRHGVPIDAKIVLFFGTPRIHKGLDTLARAISEIADPNFRLLIVGTAPDPRLAIKLDQLASGRIIYLPSQPFTAIPEILAMADVVCLPQDEGHAISKFQLPAKAIDAVAMGIPLLVSNTPPLLQLVNDQVAELVSTENMSLAIERLARSEQIEQWQKFVRGKFLCRYSYAAAAMQMRTLIQQCLDRKNHATCLTNRILEVSHHVLGSPLQSDKNRQHHSGVDVVVFWKQNDTGLYGRRHDMVIKYLASRPDVRKVVVFDAPISEFDLIKFQQSAVGINHYRWIYVGTYQKMFGTQDSGKISYNVFVYPPGKYRNQKTASDKPHMHDGYFPYVSEVLSRERVNVSESIFWIYPKNYSAPALVQHFQPARVVVDVVDDHRAWPGISADERDCLTRNYSECLALADMAFANCQCVVESMKEFFPAIRLVPNGCDERRLGEGEAMSVHANTRGVADRRKTIVFVGNLEKKIDIPLLDKLARRFNDCDIILIGSTHANPKVLELQSHKNIRFLGVIPYTDIGNWLSLADVGIIPHLNSELTQCMNPIKLYVYLSWFVPVVSTEIYNIDTSSSFVNVARNHEDFLQLVAQTLVDNKMNKNALNDYIKTNSWQNRFKMHIDELHNSLNCIQ